MIVKKIPFYLLLIFLIISCAQPQIKKEFYLGLINLHNNSEPESTGNISQAVELFESALDCTNMHIRRAAADELARLMYEGNELPVLSNEKMRKEASGAWAEAFEVIAGFPDKNKALSFLLSSEYGAAVPNNAMLYILSEYNKKNPDIFSIIETAAIQGRFAVSRSGFNEALRHFRAFQENGIWPEEIPQLFYSYPNLLNDLGRAFQYTSTGEEGIDLFLQWEKTLTEEDDDMRFSLLFFAGRIARRRGQVDRGISLFEQAMFFAPDSEQADASIWYILDSSLSRNIDACIQQLEMAVIHWHDGSYFNDILERLSRNLVLNREWSKFVHVFNLIKDWGSGVSKARYAWIIARAIDEGYLSAEDMQLTSEALNVTEMEAAAAYMQFAYNSGDTSLYYRLQCAVALGEPFLELNAVEGKTGKPSAVMEFLLGFFNNEASEFALRYIRPMEKELLPAELRSLADALYNAGMYSQSIRLVSLYINKPDYSPVRRDMELFFPRPYIELVEKYAAEFEIDPAILFGLIRTESAFQSRVVSHAGAEGLTQLMPATAEEMAGRIRRLGGPDYFLDGSLDLSDPELNIHIGAFYLNYLIERFDNILLSLMSYNGGMNRVRRWYSANSLPVDLFMETVEFYETREYGRRVMAAAAVYRELYY
jgi:soluble lytic murein transglycosylase